jgi:hypothetical protein
MPPSRCRRSEEGSRRADKIDGPFIEFSLAAESVQLACDGTLITMNAARYDRFPHTGSPQVHAEAVTP